MMRTMQRIWRAIDDVMTTSYEAVVVSASGLVVAVLLIALAIGGGTP